ncbi:MAG TPA: AgmX/PglI C-terminal domain-containing protein, partial [Nannocystis sp.]
VQGGPGTVLDVIHSTENNLGELFAAGMGRVVMPDSTEVSPFVPGGEGISAQGAIVGTKALETSGPELAELEKKERKITSSVKSTGADVFGDADKKAVQATIRQRTGALQACYNKALLTNPGLSGKISYTITISVMGTVTDVRINEDTLQDPGVQTCTVAKIKGWRFPTTPGAEQASDVTFSVVFSGGS